MNSTEINCGTKKYFGMVKQEDGEWTLSLDLRPYFPDCESNHEITNLLERRGLLLGNRIQVDPEYSCSYFYAKDAATAQQFLQLLDAQPEIVDYVEPVAEDVAVFTIADWHTLQSFLKDRLSTDDYADLKALGLKVSTERRSPYGDD